MFCSKSAGLCGNILGLQGCGVSGVSGLVAVCQVQGIRVDDRKLGFYRGELGVELG